MSFEEALRRLLPVPEPERLTYAVVVPVEFREDGAHILLEVRTPQIAQGGDPCFPGGRIEPGEGPAQAAAREMEEELGIRVDPALFWGALPTVDTYNRKRAGVFLCSVTSEAVRAARPSRGEVAQLLRVPMEFFLDHPDALRYTYEGHVIWGMTARTIRYLCSLWRRAAAAGA